MAKIANVALTNTFDTWRTRSNEAFDRLSQFAIDNSKLYANTVTANVRFVSIGATRLGTTGSNRTIINGLTSANGNLNVAGNTVLGGASRTLTVGGAGATANVTGWFGITGRATVSTNLFVAGNTTIGGALNINGAINLGDASTDLLTVTGRATVAQNLNVSGNTTIGAAGKTANATGWFGVNGRATVSTNLFVGGNTVLNGTTTDRSNALSQTLTDAATIAWDTSLGRVATVTLGASRIMGAPTNLKVGTYILSVIQGGVGSYGITWNAVFKWPAGVAPSLTTTVGARDLFTFYSDGTNLYGSYLPDVK